MIGMLWLARSCSLGSSSMPMRGSAGWKTSPLWAASWWAMKTTVRRASGSPGLGHDVPGGAVRQRAAAEPEPPAAHVVVDRRRGGAAHERGSAAAEQRRER